MPAASNVLSYPVTFVRGGNNVVRHMVLPVGFGEALKDRGSGSIVDGIGGCIASGQRQHGKRQRILILGKQRSRFRDRLFEQLGHGCTLGPQKSERPRGEPRPLDGGGGAGCPPQPCW